MLEIMKSMQQDVKGRPFLLFVFSFLILKPKLRPALFPWPI